jgi:hypothetical protein
MTNAEDSRRYQRSGSVILIEEKLQRPLGQAFNLRLILDRFANRNRPEMFDSLTSGFVFRCSASLNITGSPLR